jgi:flagellin FlaB
VKRQFSFVMIILFVTVLAVGCTDEESQIPEFPVTDAPLPGQVVVIIGDVTGDGIPMGTIDTIRFTVGLAAGEKSVPLENLSIVYADAIRTETLIPVEGLRGNPPPGYWGILEIKNEIGNPNNRLEFEEQVVIRINPKAPLVPRQFITIIIRPPTGTALTIRRVSPPSIQETNLLLPI